VIGLGVTPGAVKGQLWWSAEATDLTVFVIKGWIQALHEHKSGKISLKPTSQLFICSAAALVCLVPVQYNNLFKTYW